MKEIDSIDKNPHKGHRKRMKERMLKQGLDSFQPHEMLEILLYFTTPMKDTNPIGHRLIDAFGSVKGVLDADFEELVKVDGIGENTAHHIVLVRDMIGVYLREKAALEKLDSAKSLLLYFKGAFLGQHKEKVRLVCLNHEMQLVLDEEISSGDVGHVTLNIRQMIEVVIKSKCDLVVIAHNHPKGLAIPSKADIQNTRQVYNAFANINVKLLDHIIVGIDGEISLRSRGLLPDIWQD